MADTDRELLELAAVAAGLTGEWWERYQGEWCLCMRGEGNSPPTVWGPLTDDGDALRLLNALWLQLRHVHGSAHAGEPDKFWCTEKWFPDGNRDVATRRAIVRAAAEIGRQMRGQHE